jgi:hypothetical protein
LRDRETQELLQDENAKTKKAEEISNKKRQEEGDEKERERRRKYLSEKQKMIGRNHLQLAEGHPNRKREAEASRLAQGCGRHGRHASSSSFSAVPP